MGDLPKTPWKKENGSKPVSPQKIWPALTAGASSGFAPLSAPRSRASLSSAPRCCSGPLATWWIGIAGAVFFHVWSQYNLKTFEFGILRLLVVWSR